MATTTPNYGWPVPTSTDLVKNGATAIEGLGDAIDASLLDLKGGTTGQVLAKATNTDMDFSWTTPTDQTPLTTKGDLFTFSTVDARLGVGTNGQTLVADSSTATGLKWATPSSGASFSGTRLNKVSGNQSIPDSTYTAVTWPTEVFDVGGYHDTSTNTSRITIPSGKAGYYRFSWSQGVTAAASTCTLYTNGTGGTRNAFINVANAEANQATIILSLAVGDYVEVYLRQTSGTSKIAFDENNGAAGFVWFDCEYLGA